MKYLFKWLPPKGANHWFPIINRLSHLHLGRSVTGSKILGVFDDQDNLCGFGCVKCQRGNWYLGNCYIMERARGQGLQRELIKERLFYLALKTNVVRCGVKPDNKYSIANLKKMGFVYEKAKDDYDVYVKRW